MVEKYSKTVIERSLKMLGERIKNYLSEVGLKHIAVAEKAGFPLNTFSAMLNGKRKITAEEYFVICKVLNVPLDTFVTAS